MGFVNKKAYERFLELCPEVEKYIVDLGIVLVKFWLEVGKDEQELVSWRASMTRCASGN